MTDSGYSLPKEDIQRPGSIPDSLIEIIARDVAAIPVKKVGKAKDKQESQVK